MTTSIARIAVNGIEVGSLPRETYESIVKSTRRAPRFYFVYAKNIAVGVIRAMWIMLRSVPWFLFSIGACIAFFAPAEFASFISEVRLASAEQLATDIRQTLHTSLLLMTWACCMTTFVAPFLFRVTNPFDVEISRRIRRLLEVPTDGEITVTFIQEPAQQAA